MASSDIWSFNWSLPTQHETTIRQYICKIGNKVLPCLCLVCLCLLPCAVAINLMNQYTPRCVDCTSCLACTLNQNNAQWVSTLHRPCAHTPTCAPMLSNAFSQVRHIVCCAHVFPLHALVSWLTSQKPFLAFRRDWMVRFTKIKDFVKFIRGWLNKRGL